MDELKMSLGYSFANMGRFGQNFRPRFWAGPDLGKPKVC